MKTIISFRKILSSLLIAISLFFFTYLNAQTIVIDSTFDADGEIFPFGQNDTIYGLSISGSVELNSDTSLLRVILSDTTGNEWMVYEAYSLILPCGNVGLNNTADETKYLQVNSPYSLEIQITEASIKLDSLILEDDYSENLETWQASHKEQVESRKVDSINYSIDQAQMIWFAERNPVSDQSYTAKTSLYGHKYNLLGLDYYYGGIFDPYPFLSKETDTSDLVSEFDWRKKHDANDPNSFYFDGDPDTTYMPCNQYYYYFYEHGNGWMTSVKNQAPGNPEDNCETGCVNCCYIFGPLAIIEAVANLYYNYHYDFDLSEQYGLNCDGWPGGCSGGWSQKIFDLATDSIGGGIILESDLQWQFEEDSCNEGIQYTNKLSIEDNEGMGQGSQFTNEDVKLALLEHGPLNIRLDYPGLDHMIALVGYGILNVGDTIYNQFGDTTIVGQSYEGSLYWKFKNSGGPSWGDEGYCNFVGNPGLSPFYKILTYTYVVPPVYIENPLGFTRHYYDFDNDGYYNWGIGPKPDSLISCSEYEDSNDNDSRTGPYDTTTYIGIPILPEMVVTFMKLITLDTLQNGGYFYFDGDTANDITKEFIISNPGTAQLNLDQYYLTNDGIITIEDEFPSGQFEIQDRPDNAICMNDDTTTFKITLKHGAEDGSFAKIHIHINEPDMDSIFEFTMVFNGCETESGYDSVNTVVNWSDTCISQHKDLHIQNGGELTISGTVLLSPDADIIVEKGGELIIDGGKLTRSCEDELWNGIQVWGDSSLSQYPYSNQGFLNIKNNGGIEYAKTGIFTGKYDNEEALYNYSGGIVVAEDAIFLNNEVDAEFLPFINDHPISGNEIDNYSGFRYCSFKTYDPELVLNQPDAHVILDGVKGIDFSSCTFINQEVPGHPFDDDKKGTGILVYDSDVAVTAFCSEPETPCDEYDSSYFENLRYGIRAFNTGGNKFFRVSEAVFDSNIAGIYLSGFHQPEIVSSYFYSCLEYEQISGLNDPFYGGLYIDGSTGYHIENNYFKGPYSDVPDSGYIAKIGVYVKGSGDDDNEIYNNFFIGIDAGIIAEGVNKGDTTGLCLKCNDFRTCLNDMLVFEGDEIGGRYIGIKENQGTNDTISTSLSGNTFTPEVQGVKATDNGAENKYYWSYFNNADNINYYHHDEHLSFETYPSDSNITKETINLENKYVDYVKEEACPSGLNNNHYKNYSDPRQEIAQADSQLIPLRYNYNVLLDGGNTDELDFDIITSLPDDALELRQQLLADSPYLSDTIMKQAIYKENVLPNAMIRDVLTANPQSAKSNEILDAVDGRYDPMPDYMMAEIMQGLDQIGALESLESKIGYWKQYRSRAINRLIREYLTDSTIINRNDSLINLFQNELSLQSKYRLAFTYWENNQASEAMNALDDISTTFELTTRELEIHQDYLDYFDILQMMKDSNFNARDLDSSSIQSLTTIMNNDLPLISAYTRGLLLRGRHIDYTETVAFPSGVKSYPAYYYIDPQQFDFHEEEHLVLFPNPSGDYVIAYFNSNDLGETGSLAIDNIHGQRVTVIKLDSEQNQLVIDLSNLPNGLYFVSLIINNELIESEKLLKGRY